MVAIDDGSSGLAESFRVERRQASVWTKSAVFLLKQRIIALGYFDISSTVCDVELTFGDIRPSVPCFP